MEPCGDDASYVWRACGVSSSDITFAQDQFGCFHQGQSIDFGR